MRHPFYFIVKPVGGRYKSSQKIAGVDVVVSTTVEDHRYVNRLGEVISVPGNYSGEIRAGDKVIIHHNVFRDFFDHKGRFKHSNDHIEDGHYYITEDVIYLYGQPGEWNCNLDYCFVSPKVGEHGFEPLRGKVVYSKQLEAGTEVIFSPHSEYEVSVDGNIMYRMKERDIAAIYEEVK